jgi:hypothetical protein
LASSRDSLNGPDWLDIQRVIAEVEMFHTVSVMVEVMIPRPGRKGLLEVRAVATRLLPPPGDRRPSVSRSVAIFSGDPRTVAATIFRLVYDLDRDCGAMWAQSELFRYRSSGRF